MAALILVTLLAGCGTAQPGHDAAAAPQRSTATAAATKPTTPPPPTATPPTSPSTAVTPTAVTPTAAKPDQQLPQGGTKIFPDYRVVAYYGTAGTGALGVLGEASPDATLPQLRRVARPFAGGRKIQVAYELIATVAQGSPGPDGDYSRMIDPARIRQYVDQARRNNVLVILDLQPGRGDFLTQARRLEPFLIQPHVGLALDPEWRMARGQVPGKTIGSVGAGEVNSVSDYVSRLVATNHLPEKLFVLHQFRTSMLPDVQKVVGRPGLAMVQHVDGFGTRAEKDATWNRLRRPQQFHLGYKLFYDEDVQRYHPAEVLRFTPAPELISYQ
jgi:hypothetical protein